MVRFENVGVRYGPGPEVLKDVSFELDSGSFHFITGASGAGKSTLLRLLYLAMRPTRGLITLFNRDISTVARKSLPEMRRRIGVVFQDFRLVEHLTAFDNVALPLRVAEVKESHVKQHVSELLTWVGLGDRMASLPATLSGGEKQRVAIARAVIARPKILLADEPTGSVDTGLGLRLLTLFEELNRLGTTIVIATHDEQLVSRFAHPILHLDKGELQKLKTSAAVAALSGKAEKH